MINVLFYEKYDSYYVHDMITIFGTIWGRFEVKYEMNARFGQEIGL